VAIQALAHGHEVVLSNSRGPETLADLVAKLGDGASAATAAQAAADADLVVVAVPLKNYQQLPADALAGRVVADANNYYPQRDGQIAELDDGSTTSSELLARQLPGAHVVKAFNTIYFVHLAEGGQPAGTPGRRAVAIAGDDAQAKQKVAALLDEFGFEAVDAGPLAEGRRFQPGTPAYGKEFDADALRTALASA
jgi:predicted dinucleotide-binding enzyme